MMQLKQITINDEQEMVGDVTWCLLLLTAAVDDCSQTTAL